MDETYRTQSKTKSRRSATRMTHGSLKSYLAVENYFTDAFTVEKIRTIFMERREILPLSYIPNVTASDTVCPIYNMREQENVVHFIGRCPSACCILVRHSFNRGAYSIRWMGNVCQLSTPTSTSTETAFKRIAFKYLIF